MNRFLSSFLLPLNFCSFTSSIYCILCLCIIFQTNCALTLDVREKYARLDTHETKTETTEHSSFNHSLFTVAQGDDIFLQLKTTKTREAVDKIQVQEIYGMNRKVLGQYGITLRSWYLFWPKNGWNKEWGDDKKGGLGVYIVFNSLFAIPTLGLSLVIMAADIISLPIRLWVVPTSGKQELRTSEIQKNRLLDSTVVPSDSVTIQCNGVIVKAPEDDKEKISVSSILGIIPHPWEIKCSALDLKGNTIANTTIPACNGNSDAINVILVKRSRSSLLALGQLLYPELPKSDLGLQRLKSIGSCLRPSNSNIARVIELIEALQQSNFPGERESLLQRLREETFAALEQI